MDYKPKNNYIQKQKHWHMLIRHCPCNLGIFSKKKPKPSYLLICILQMMDLAAKREENIARNEAFLASLGLSDIKPSIEKKKNEELIKTSQRVKKQKREEKKANILPTRRSRRVANVKEEEVKAESKEKMKNEGNEDNEDEEDDYKINYDLMPEEKEDLDDHEYKAYKIIQRWRLNLARELGIESYKVFQNKTLAIVIRKRRNDILFGKNKENNNSNDVEALPDIAEMLSVWGIGPAKVAVANNASGHDGFALQLIHFMDKSDYARKIEELLEKSRNGIEEDDDNEAEGEKKEFEEQEIINDEK